MFDWLKEAFDLTIEEATQVMRSSIENKIAEIVGPKIEVVAMIKKSEFGKNGSSSPFTPPTKMEGIPSGIFHAFFCSIPGLYV